MILVIPVQSGTDAFTQTVDLDGSLYSLAFRWNARDERWMLDVLSAGAPIISGVKLVTGDEDLLGRDRRIAGLPPGRLFVDDLDDLGRDPNEDLFGDRVLLKYETAFDA